MAKSYIVGTGGFAREVLFLMDELGMYNTLHGFIEPDHIWEEKWKDKTIMDKPVFPFSDVKAFDQITIGVADSNIRRKTISQLPKDVVYLSLVHPNVSISKWCKIGLGSIITAGCILTTQIEIGDHCHLNLGTTIGHDCNIGDFFTTAPSVNISGICNIGNNVYFGTGAATKQGINICHDVTIGMGAMVTKSITESGTYVGIPAKKM